MENLNPSPRSACRPAAPRSPAAFAFARTPELHFGAGKIAQLPALIAARGQRVLLVTGASFAASARYAPLIAALAAKGIDVRQAAMAGEPSPEAVDAASEKARGEAIDIVVALGGGSVLDAGKAISAMLPQEGSVADFLEGIEARRHDGRKTPFIAVPTSSGTGSEATKNAVLSRIGASGFKSSLRHDNLVPDVALIDPELMLSCPRAVTAACGLDALTQLLEAYVSTRASSLTDALAVEGLKHVAAGFINAREQGETHLAARAHMAYAAYLSGLALANAGLGVVHGLAGPLGGLFPVPHGEACGTLLAEATRLTLENLRADPAANATALEKYARAGVILSGESSGSADEDALRLVQTLADWTERTAMPKLSRYGVTRADLPRIVERASNKNNPAVLDATQLTALLEARR